MNSSTLSFALAAAFCLSACGGGDDFQATTAQPSVANPGQVDALPAQRYSPEVEAALERNRAEMTDRGDSHPVQTSMTDRGDKAKPTILVAQTDR